MLSLVVDGLSWRPLKVQLIMGKSIQSDILMLEGQILELLNRTASTQLMINSKSLNKNCSRSYFGKLIFNQNEIRWQGQRSSIVGRRISLSPFTYWRWNWMNLKEENDVALSNAPNPFFPSFTHQVSEREWMNNGRWNTFSRSYTVY